jgi:hypothetical protein
MDMSDAVNIMVHSTPANGVALWHIFAVDDAEVLRTFIRDHLGCSDSGGDPIHCQRFYLTPTHLAQLETLYGVWPFMIEQRVNQAMFIPAGCAHQVIFSSRSRQL